MLYTSGETEGNSLNLELDVKEVGRALRLGELVQARLEEEVMGCLVCRARDVASPFPRVHTNF